MVQERSLSIRTLHFDASQLFWECFTQQACEVFPADFLRGTLRSLPKLSLDWEEKPGLPRRNRVVEYQNGQKAIEGWREARKIHQEQNLSGLECWKVQMRILGLTDFSAFDFFNLKPEPDSEGFLEASELGLNEAFCIYGVNLNAYDDIPINQLGWYKKKAREFLSMQANIKYQPGDNQEYRPALFTEMREYEKHWCAMVKTYSGCSLTFSSDKLIAVSGLARRYSQFMKCQYLSEIWRRNMEHQLLWRVIGPKAPIITDGTRGPSWS